MTAPDLTPYVTIIDALADLVAQRLERRRAEGARLLTPAETGLGPRVAIRAIRDGQLPALRVGRGWRIRAEDLEHYLQARSTREEQPSEIGSLAAELGLTPTPTAERH